MNSVSIYFPAGDFVDVLRRYDEGLPQKYQTHNEVARLIHDLRAANQHVNVYSFVTPERHEVRLDDGSRVVSLGARDFSVKSLLRATVAADNVDAIVVHFPNTELLRAATTTMSRVVAVLASSYNRTGIRSTLMKRRIVSLLNDPRVELVSNHCLPATEHLARLGVRREKLIAWDVSHPVEPSLYQPKKLAVGRCFEVVYAGSITEDKGIADLIRAIALLRGRGIEVHCSLAGLGEIDAMQALGARLGVSDLLSFLRLVDNPQVLNMMARADIVVVPSRANYPEGFPLSMFEAIASRTPIVCSDHPMFRDVMVDGRSASVFSAGDYRAFAAAIWRTLTNPGLYSALSMNAPLTWAALQGPADWRTMIFKWVVEGDNSPWIRNRMLMAAKPTSGRFTTN